MLTTQEKKIKDCYEAFLRLMPEENRDLWAITLLEYYRFPLEWWRAEPDEEQNWQLPVPDCFAQLLASGELERLVRYKEDVCPNGDFCSVQRNLELEYDWLQARGGWGAYSGVPRHTLPLEALRLLVEYCILVEELGDEAGDRKWRYLFDETSDVDMLVTMAKQSAQTPAEEFGCILLLEQYRQQVELKARHNDWLFDQLWDWLGWVMHLEEGEVSWALYQYLQENDGRFALWDNDMTNFELVRRAAEAGIVEAKLELGELYIEDRRADENRADGTVTEPLMAPEQVIAHLQDALPVDSLAGVLLALIYRQGYGVPASEQKALEVCRITAQTQYGDQPSAVGNQETCIRWLAEAYATGCGLPADPHEAARLYRRLGRSDGEFMFRYHSEGEYAPRNARLAVHWWLRDHRYGSSFYFGEVWLNRLQPGSGTERADELRSLKQKVQPGEWEQTFRQANLREQFYRWLEEPAPPQSLQPLAELFLRDKARLLYDAAKAGDARCAAILERVCARDPQVSGWLPDLALDADGIWDWPEAWYKEALEEIEWQEQLQKAEEERMRQNLQMYREAVQRLCEMTEAERQAQFCKPKEEQQPTALWVALTDEEQEQLFNALDLDDELWDPADWEAEDDDPDADA